MPTFPFQQSVKEFFITPGRTRQTLILCRNSDGLFVLGKKRSYPEGINRMVGGGIEGEENPFEGTKRELKEELNLDINSNNLKELCLVNATFNRDSEVQNLDVYVYFYNLDNTQITAGDDVAEFAYLNMGQLNELVIRLNSLSGTYPDKYGKASEMLWADWGKMHSFILQKAIDCYLELGL